MWTYENLYYECRRLAQIAHERYMRDIYTLLYLVGLKEHGKWITILVSQDKAEGECFVLTEHIPRNMDLNQLTDWIQTRMRREPVL